MGFTISRVLRQSPTLFHSTATSTSTMSSASNVPGGARPSGNGVGGKMAPDRLARAILSLTPTSTTLHARLPSQEDVQMERKVLQTESLGRVRARATGERPSHRPPCPGRGVTFQHPHPHPRLAGPAPRPAAHAHHDDGAPAAADCGGDRGGEEGWGCWGGRGAADTGGVPPASRGGAVSLRDTRPRT